MARGPIDIRRRKNQSNLFSTRVPIQELEKRRLTQLPSGEIHPSPKQDLPKTVFSTLNVIYNNGGTVNSHANRDVIVPDKGRHLAEYKLRASLQGIPTNYPLISQTTPFKNASLVLPT